MKLAILGTGGVAQALAKGWTAAGHEVTLGSRSPAAHADLPYAVAERGEAVGSAEAVVNATPGAVSLAVVEAIGAESFAGKLLLDVANASTPAFELVYPNASLAEALQETLPGARVVKSLNTFSALVMTDPSTIEASTVFLSGNDAGAKDAAAGLVRDLGWPQSSILDLGGIASARGPEHYFMLFASLMQALKTPTFNVRVVQ